MHRRILISSFSTLLSIDLVVLQSTPPANLVSFSKRFRFLKQLQSPQPDQFFVREVSRSRTGLCWTMGTLAIEAFLEDRSEMPPLMAVNTDLDDFFLATLRLCIIMMI